MRVRPFLFGFFATAAVIAGTVLGLVLLWDRSVSTPEALSRGLWLGPPVLELDRPAPGEFPVGGVGVLVRFPDRERVAPGTFRCLLNGRDVTYQLTLAANGAGGSVWPLQPGENTLRVEVFGQSWLSSSFYEDAAEVAFTVRPPLSLDRG